MAAGPFKRQLAATGLHSSSFLVLGVPLPALNISSYVCKMLLGGIIPLPPGNQYLVLKMKSQGSSPEEKPAPGSSAVKQGDRSRSPQNCKYVRGNKKV